MKKVLIAGGFDPFHEGHLDHIKKASKLGEVLLVSVAKDSHLINKKGRVGSSQGFRIDLSRMVLMALKIRGQVFLSLGEDGTQVETLEEYRPHIFAKGGDRTRSNMPKEEVDICFKRGIEIKYGIGDLLNSSSEIMGVK